MQRATLPMLSLAAALLAGGCQIFEDDDSPAEGDDRSHVEVLADSPNSYTNPVYKADFPDPFILAHGGKFYAYATQKDATGFQAMESPDLVHWTHKGGVFVPPWSKEHLWAPEVFERSGLFYMTYSARNPKTGVHDIAIATARSPLGPFQHRAVLVTAESGSVGVIDATIFIDADNSAYLLYSSESPRAIILTALKPDWLSVTPERTELLYSDQPWEKGVTEAPTLVHRDGYYHLFFSGGPFQGRKHREMYAVGHAVSRSLRGPYTKDRARLLESVRRRVHGPGHQCVVHLESGEDWILYHAWDNQKEPFYGSNPLGRTLRLDRLYIEGPRAWVSGPTTGPAVRPTVSRPAS